MASELIGRTLGDFRVEAHVGSGSMAHVYEAEQISLRRKVALKVLQEGLFTPGDNLRRFLREAEALARLEHSNIVPVYAAGADASFYFFAMRLVRGGTLDDVMRSGMMRTTALNWILQICQALAYAHEAGVIHRDLKPTNVLIQDGVALLSDFGLARLRDVSTITHPGHILGTPLYMSPEQTCGETVGPGADCFALGVLMYQMLTGRHPFAHPIPRTLPTQERRTRLFRAIQEARCHAPSTYDEKIPKTLDEVIMLALARNPQDRYRDAPAMLQALNQVLRQIPDDESVIRYDMRAEDPHTPLPQPMDMLRSTATSDVRAAASRPAHDSIANSRDEEKRLDRTGDTTHSDAPHESAAAVKQEKPQGVLGRYKLLKQIGHGGQGVVYEAHDAVLDRTVALKVLRKDVLNENNLDELFWHEARVAARLNHPHIITIYDFGIEDKQPYITMQLIDGPSLDKLIENKKPLPLSFALQVLIQAADAIGFAHEAGIVHLDIKPGNILIRATLRGSAVASEADETIRKLGRPHVILSDFTMARISRAAKMEREFSDGSMAGTLAYAAPEQLDGRGEVGPVSDLFALGVVFYEMVTGGRLFCSDNPIVSRELLLSGGVPPPSSKIHTLPREVDELCARLICRKSQERLQSASELISAAERLMP